jgi:hypothetical protein
MLIEYNILEVNFGDIIMRKLNLLSFIFNLVLLSNLCWASDSNNPGSILKRRLAANQLLSVLDINNITDGRILPTSKSDCVREISAEIIFSQKLREGIDENIKKSVEAAFKKDGDQKLLCVSLKIDFDRLMDELRTFDPNTLYIAINASPDFGRAKIGPITVLANERGTDWQGRYLKTDLLFSLPEIKLAFTIFANNVNLTSFTFRGELAGMRMENASEQNDIFPKIKPLSATGALSWITAYARKRDLKPLGENHMRYFQQPKGIVSQCIDVNLVSGDVLSYPGTHDTTNVRKATISSKELKDIRDVLTSKEFIRVPQQNNSSGIDGHSDIIEVDFDGSYLWKMHWVTKDMNFINAMNKIGAILKPYDMDIGIPLQQRTNIVNVFN